MVIKVIDVFVSVLMTTLEAAYGYENKTVHHISVYFCILDVPLNRIPFSLAAVV